MPGPAPSQISCVLIASRLDAPVVAQLEMHITSANALHVQVSSGRIVRPRGQCESLPSSLLPVMVVMVVYSRPLTPRQILIPTLMFSCWNIDGCVASTLIRILVWP